MNLKKALPNVLGVIAVCLLAAFTAEAKLSSRVLLIPLDSRPLNLQIPVRLGFIGDVEVVTPPRELLGNADSFGETDKIIEWLGQQNLRTFDAAIMSIDMLSYGGLAAARTSRSASFDLAKRRLATLVAIHERNPHLRIFAVSAIIRAFPLPRGNERFGALLERWTQLSDQTDNEKSVEADEIAKAIPSEILDEYRNTRTRNLNLSLLAVRYVRDGILSHLILAQDTAESPGVNVTDRETLMRSVKEKGVEKTVSTRTGAEESFILFLARFMNAKYRIHPRVSVTVSKSNNDGTITDSALDDMRRTAANDISIAGGVMVGERQRSDISLFVVGADKDSVSSTTDAIEKKVLSSRFSNVAIADIGLKNGADFEQSLTGVMQRRSLIGKLAGYAARDRADATIGRTLGQAMLSHLSRSKFSVRKNASLSRRVEYARKWFMLDRVLEDVLYGKFIAREMESVAKTNGWNPRNLDSAQINDLQRISTEKMSDGLDEYLKSVETLKDGNATCSGAKYFKVLLPWRNTSDPELDFELTCRSLRR